MSQPVHHTEHLFPRPAPFPPLALFDPHNTIGHALETHPTWAPKRAAAHLFPKPWPGARLWRRITIKRDLLEGREWTPQELNEAAARGNFPERPSDLFLRIYADILTCLTRDPLAGNVSPPLIGTGGTIPLSIISTIPDIMRHYRDCIVLAEKEVFLVTNYWQPSNSVSAIAEALIELNRRVQERKGVKIVVKIMWDRGAWEQLVRNHAGVDEKTWVPLGLPSPSAVPNLSLQVINFHRPLLGTFHQKAMVVDRKLALLNSNNIQDRPNIEMMVHLEGRVVDSIYDVLLLSWHEAFSPALPCSGLPSVYSSDPDYPYTFADENPFLAEIDVTKAAKAARKLLKLQNEKTVQLGEHHPDRWWRRSSQGVESAEGSERPGSAVTTTGSGGTGFAHIVSQLVERAREERARRTSGQSNGSVPPVSIQKPSVPTVPEETLPLSNEDDKVEGSASSVHKDSSPSTSTSEEQEKSVLEEKETQELHVDEDKSRATKVEASSEPSAALNAPKASLAPNGGLDPKGDARTEEEAARGSSKEGGASFTDLRFSKLSATSTRLRALSGALNAGALSELHATIDDESLVHDFSPHLLHKSHKPFPIALANRRPHGMPGHQDIRVPQSKAVSLLVSLHWSLILPLTDAAWLGGFRYAQESVFIQTPTLNASPVVKAVLEACKNGGPNGTGIQVTLFLDLGFNDKGESVPFQGGTNEEVVLRLYKDLTKAKKEQNLHVFWYTGKDQCKPVNAVHKTRNCHVKFMAIDGQCAIVGNGNQDTQSWFHSQECNILIDNPDIVSSWMDQLRSNQSTHTYGRVDTDGIWRDPKTKEPLQAPKSVSCFSAMWAMI